MKLITAIVKPERLDDVTRAVTDAGAHGMTVTEVRGFGQQYGHAVHPDDRQVLMLPKLRIDVAAEDQLADLVVDAIAKSVNTGTIGDGKPGSARWRARSGSGPASATATRCELRATAAHPGVTAPLPATLLVTCGLPL